MDPSKIMRHEFKMLIRYRESNYNRRLRFSIETGVESYKCLSLMLPWKSRCQPGWWRRKCITSGHGDLRWLTKCSHGQPSHHSGSGLLGKDLNQSEMGQREIKWSQLLYQASFLQVHFLSETLLKKDRILCFPIREVMITVHGIFRSLFSSSFAISTCRISYPSLNSRT